MPDTARKPFLLATAICAFGSVLTTAVLVYFPVKNAAVSFPGLEALNDPGYWFYQLFYLLHPFVTLTAALGVAYAKFKDKAGWVSIGFLFFLFWGYSEALQQSLSIVANNLTWRKQYLSADTDPIVKEMLRTNMEGFYGIYDAIFFLLLIGFCLGSLFYGIAFVTSRAKMEKVMGGMYLFLSFLTLTSILTYANINITLFDGVYPFIQLPLRVMIGLWLIMQVRASVEVTNPPA